MAIVLKEWAVSAIAELVTTIIADLVEEKSHSTTGLKQNKKTGEENEKSGFSFYTFEKRERKTPELLKGGNEKYFFSKWKCQDYFCNLTTLMTVSVMPPFVLLGIFTSMSGSTPPLKEMGFKMMCYTFRKN